MAELATIARPYAEALYQVVQADAPAALAWLDVAAAVATMPEMLELAQNPKVASEKVTQVLTELVAAKASINDAGKNFLRLVVANGRLAALGEVAAQVRERHNARQGVSEAQVFSAFDLDGQTVNDLSTALEKRFGRKLQLSIQVDPELIGGVRVVVGDEVLDTSVKARLQQMKAALTA
jgi:F-type H+-transporting ATPase subunit delta